MDKIVYNDVPVFIRDFLSYMETIKGKSINTVNEYYFDLRTFFRFMLVHRGITDFEDFEKIDITVIDSDFLKTITLHDLYEYLSYTSRERLNNANSRARKVASLRTFFKYANTKAKLIDENPASDLDSPKIPKSLPKYLSLDESKNLLKAIDGNNKLRDFAIITLFLNCGLRLSELAGININAIRDDKLVVIGKGNKERTIYLNKACLDAINDYLQNERPKDGIKAIHKNALFISRNKQRISVKTIQYIVKKHMESAGLDTSKYSVHKLRHTAATLMYRYGNVDVRVLQQILGHTSLATTQIYTHLDDEQLRKAAGNNPLADFSEKE